MWRKEVRGSNNCLSGLTRLELNHRKNCWKSQVSFLSETEKYPLPASSAGQHFGPSRAGENLILLIVAVDFLRNFSEILCTGLIFQPLRLRLHFPWGLEEAEKIMAGAGFWLQIYTFHIPSSSGNNSTVRITQNSKGREVIFWSNFHIIVGGNVLDPRPGFIDNWLMGLVAEIVSLISGENSIQNGETGFIIDGGS